jgi:hypothetical protein
MSDKSAFPHHDVFGMTLRDYFAAAALTGICSQATQKETEERAAGMRGGAIFAAAAYVLADAMMRERT